jgi:ribose transport system ATP-binding protein
LDNYCAPILDVTALHKSYAANHVLSDVSFSMKHGEILALLGENGAGKSTLIKILSGAVRPDTGTVAIAGKSIHAGDTALARQRGIAVVYQELSLCGHLSVEDNILLGREHHRFGILRRDSQRNVALSALTKLGQPSDWLDRQVDSLSVGQKQLVEIARAIAQDAKILILDEPTSSLTQSDVRQLFNVVRRLRDQGMAVIYISHFLEEVRSLCSSFLVLRDGAVAGRGMLDQTDQRQLLKMMAGRDIEQLYPPRKQRNGITRLTTKKISGSSLPRDVSLELNRGEILGIAGLVGAGRTELLRSIFGLDRLQQGTIQLDNDTLPNDGNVARRIKSGIAMISEDRKQEGLAQSMSIADNMTLSHLAPFTSLGWINEKKRQLRVDELKLKFSIKAPHSNAAVWTLSGGNQQKVALARALHQEGTIWLLDEPTRGIDVGTKAEIYRWMSDLADQGHSLLFVSSYFQELLATCDRIAVIARGRLVAIRATEQWTEHELMHCAMQGVTGTDSTR